MRDSDKTQVSKERRNEENGHFTDRRTDSNGRGEKRGKTVRPWAGPLLVRFRPLHVRASLYVRSAQLFFELGD
jgi:hypothetical protein